jgi:hypothetical protein
MRALLTLGLLAIVANAAHAELLMYESFSYPYDLSADANSNLLVGKANANGKAWIDPTAPAQQTGANDTHRIVANDHPFPGLASVADNQHFTVPFNPTSNITRTVLPLPAGRDPVVGAYTSSDSSLFYSLTLRLNEFTNRSETFIPLVAGFHWGNDVVGAGMTTVQGFAGSLRLTKAPADPNTNPLGNKYLVGLSKDGNTNLPTHATNPSTIVWDTTPRDPVNDTLLIVVEYDLVGDNTNTPAVTTDDVAKMWINPTPGLPAGAPTLIASTGPDSFASQAAVPASGIPFVPVSGALRSFYFRSHAQASWRLHFDDLRIGATFADVTPAVPEPSTTVLAAIGIAALGMRRRLAG